MLVPVMRDDQGTARLAQLSTQVVPIYPYYHPMRTHYLLMGSQTAAFMGSIWSAVILRLSAELPGFSLSLMTAILHRSTRETHATWLLHWFQIAVTPAKQG